MKQKIKEIFSQLNISEVSFCEFQFVEGQLLECRAKNRLPNGAQTVIMAAFPFKVMDAPPKNISRYAAVKDYHIVCADILNSISEILKDEFPQNNFEVFVDNSPISEVAAGVHSGLGVMGKNGLLINQKYGSYVFLGEIVTDLYIEADKGDKKCLDCSRCISVCPVKLCKRDCLSAVNQQKSEPNDNQKLQIKQSGCVWGCDKCMDVCPMNKNKPSTNIEEFINSYRDAFSPDEDRRHRAYNWRKNVIDRNYEIINCKD